MSLKPDHSDILIHWTGRDIDEEYGDFSGQVDPRVIPAYLQRLKFMLKYGLWMTQGRHNFEVAGTVIKRPPYWRTCFTELKLSEAAIHAEKFGRLGIGVKRFFLFNRLGSPMCYYQPYRHTWFTLPYAAKESPAPAIDEYWSCFLKSMDEKQLGKWVEYKQFEESEWRIIYSDKICERLNEYNKPQYNEYFKKLEAVQDVGFQDYVRTQCEKNKCPPPQFLIPLQEAGSGSGARAQWFAVIIYPHIGVKVAAEADPEIRKAIRALKPDCSQRHSSSAGYEEYCKPIEIDLGACKNF